MRKQNRKIVRKTNPEPKRRDPKEGLTMSKTETALLNLIKERSFRMGTFKLASGKMSDYYIDGKSTIVSSEGAFLVGEFLFEQTQHRAIEAIARPETSRRPPPPPPP